MLLTDDESLFLHFLPRELGESIVTSPKQESKPSRVRFLAERSHCQLIFPAESLRDIWLNAPVKSMVGVQGHRLSVCYFSGHLCVLM